ncbi:cellulase family glycosylhydrolase [Cellvibrio sp. QJXJ]|uniref:cellulase family glycosylhydrolase n=1 Tax=Cellvibrio sp. QJXJ TaxID=2964606 RepID=UPI0021C318EA|nr:cellulase family glycosylhydrolase [Cellvibrio sp. QJXJ]UUA71990.1 cellulase family glycosylhydrolase [Cellvibrio sp. QJXJ]
MKNLTTLKKSLVKKSSLALATSMLLASAMVAPAFAGWTVNGTQVLDPNGNSFVFRGVNHAHTWYTDRLNKSLSDIAATGANSVRVVLSNGTQWTRNNGADVTNVINQCKVNKLVCVLEVHDSTGFGESAAATHISRATEYWLSADIKAAITGQEDYVIVNIANEPFGNSTSAATYTNDHITAIRALRAGGLTHMLMVDAANWGQDWQNAMRDNAPTILAADTLQNVVFSVHMYEVYNNAAIVQSYLNSFQTRGLAIVVGEFGAEHNGSNVVEEAILQYAQDMGIGYLGWSWSGNGSCCVPLDIVNNWNPASLSTWGNFLINSANGIKATAKLATHFGSTSSSSSVVSSSSIAPSSSSAPSSSATSSSSSSSSIAGNETCNWYGNRYPICVTTVSGWGWENQQSCVGRTSCAALPAPWGIEGSGTASSAPSSSAPSSAAPSSVPASSSSAAPSSIPASSSAASSSLANTGGVSCSYVVTNSWGSGFTGAIRVTNTGTASKSGWSASWQYSGNNRITSSWNTNLSGSNPYTATNVSWNGTIAAGQTVEIGFQGNTNGGSVEVPAVTCR